VKKRLSNDSFSWGNEIALETEEEAVAGVEALEKTDADAAALDEEADEGQLNNGTGGFVEAEADSIVGVSLTLFVEPVSESDKDFCCSSWLSCFLFSDALTHVWAMVRIVIERIIHIIMMNAIFLNINI